MFAHKKQVFLAISLCGFAAILGVFLTWTFYPQANRQSSQLVMSATQKKNVPTPSALPTLSPTPTPIPQLQRPIYLGMWTQGLWDDGAKTLHPEVLEAMEQKVGKKIAIAHYYRGWQYLESPSVVAELTELSAHGWRPMLSANPYFFEGCHKEGQSLYKTIADGHCDTFLHNAGKNLASFTRPFFFRFAWEMNIDSIEWGVPRTGDSPQDYSNAWRHIHDIFMAEGATNISWVFSPNTLTTTSTAYSALYPGDAYVDWLGLDGYNWGTTQPWSSWLTFSDVFAPSYTMLSTIAPTKPLMLAEVNTTDVGGDKAVWFADMFERQLPYAYPQIRAVVLYNEDRSATEHVNWLIDVSPASLVAFRNGISQSSIRSSF